jgi:hypothetical protein
MNCRIAGTPTVVHAIFSYYRNPYSNSSNSVVLKENFTARTVRRGSVSSDLVRFSSENEHLRRHKRV